MVQKYYSKGGLVLTEYKRIKKWLFDNEHTLKWLWRIVRTKGFGSLAYNRFCEIMNGSYLGGYAPNVIATAKQVINNYEKQKTA